MPRVWVRVMLFCSSYFPLMLIFAVLNWQRNMLAAIIIFGFAILCFLLTWLYIEVTRARSNTQTRAVQKVQPHEADVLNYIAAYIIPFVTLPFNNWANGLAVVILLTTLGTVYVQSNMIAVNPTLSFLGFHLYEVIFKDDEHSHIVISRRTIVVGQPITVASLRNVLYLQTPERTRRYDPDAPNPTDDDGD